VVELIRDAFRNERLVEKLGLKIASSSDGVPFFVFEMIRGLKEGQFVTQLADGSWVESKVIEKIEIPSAVKDLIDVRLGDLTKEHRDLVDVGAVHGYEFDPEIVAAVIERRPIAVLQDLAFIERRFGVVRAAGRRARFDHHQIQEVVYADLPQALREGYHALLAETMEAQAGAAAKEPKDVDGALCVELAEHFLAGNRGARALRYLDGGLTYLQKRYLNERATALAERALAMPGLVVDTQRVQVLLFLSRRFELAGRREPQRVALAESLALARAIGDRRSEISALGNLAETLRGLGRFVEAREHVEKGLALSRQMGNRQDEAVAMGILGNILLSMGRSAEAQEYSERLVALSRDIGDRHGEARGMGNLGNVMWSIGRYAEAQECFERWLALSRETSDRRYEATAMGNLGTAFMSLGRHAEARECHERSLAIQREIGDRPGEALATGNLGNDCHAEGCHVEAREHFQRSLALARECGDGRSEIRALGSIAAALACLGRVAEAREHGERALVLARERGDRHFEGYSLVELAEQDEDCGRTADAEAKHREAIVLRDEIGEKASAAKGRASLGAILARAGRADEARTLLAAACATARELELPETEATCLAYIATLPGGDAAVAEEALVRHDGRLPAEVRMDVRMALYHSTGRRSHIEEAKRVLDEALSRVPGEFRASMLANVRLNRDIAAAAKAAGL
jgi:tetratricopeptide (TPR) repeat protein